MALSVFRLVGGRMLANMSSKKSACQYLASNLYHHHTGTLPAAAAAMCSKFRPNAMQQRGLHLSTQNFNKDKRVVDLELAQFLDEEIAAETKAQKREDLPSIDNFQIKTSGSNVTLTQAVGDENVTIKLNVNHSIDSDSQEEMANQEELTQMESRPTFTVEIEKGGNVLAFGLSFATNYTEQEEGAAAEEEEGGADAFNIDEVVFHKGTWNEATYSVSGEIIDGYLYDLMMNYLELRGINASFTKKLSEFCTTYEHKQYIDLLQNVKAFVSGVAPKIQDQASRKQ